MESTTSSPKRKFIVTFISATVFSLVLCQRHAGFLIIFFVIPFLIWLFYSFYIAIKNPILKSWIISRIVTWCVAFLLVFIVHLHYHQATREYANKVAALILQYKENHGTYPIDLEQLGIEKSELRRNLGMGRYSLNESKPSLFYGVTYIAFDVYVYNFESKSWEYQS